MARDMSPVLKRCRSLDLEPTFLGIDKKSNRKSARAGKKMSEYGLQLREKQKAKFIYGVLEKPFRNNFERAKKMKNGTAGENLLIILELRLDNVMFRMGYALMRTCVTAPTIRPFWSMGEPDIPCTIPPVVVRSV